MHRVDNCYGVTHSCNSGARVAMPSLIRETGCRYPSSWRSMALVFRRAMLRSALLNANDATLLVGLAGCETYLW